MGRLLLPPKQPGKTNEDWTEVKSVVVVGANGSGKSQVGAWIEQHNPSSPVHRVSAQRALSMPDLVNPMPYERATSQLHYGSYQPSWSEDQRRSNKVGHRWGNDPVGHMLTDYEFVVSALFAEEAKRDREYSRAASASIPTAKPPDCQTATSTCCSKSGLSCFRRGSS